MSKTNAVNPAEAFILTWDEVKPCTYKVTCTLPAENVGAVYKLITKDIVRQASIPGFRPGTAPVELVTARYKDSIANDVLTHCVRSAFDKMISDPDRKVIGYRIESEDTLTINPNQDGTVIFEVSVAPTFDLPEYKGLKLDIERKTVTEDAVEKRLEALRFSYGEFKTITEELKSADLAQVSYTADIVLPDDAPSHLKALCHADKTWVWVEKEGRIPNMDAALLGKKTGDKVAFDAVFAEDFTEPLLAGKTIKYDVEVFETQRRIALTDNDELCKRMTVANMDELVARIRKDLEEEAKMDNEQRLGEAAKDKVISDTAAFEMPEAIVEKETNSALRQIANEVVKSDADAAAFNAARAEHETEAKKRGEKSAREHFILSAIAAKENITVTEEEMDAQIEGMAQYFGLSPEEMLKRIRERGAESDIAQQLLMRKVSAFLAENAAQ